jgi:hypothetical protein
MPLRIHCIVGRQLRAGTARFYARRPDAFARDHADDYRKSSGYNQQPAIEALAAQMLMLFVGEAGCLC